MGNGRGRTQFERDFGGENLTQATEAEESKAHESKIAAFSQKRC
jgi:hypothetical protein